MSAVLLAPAVKGEAQRDVPPVDLSSAPGSILHSDWNERSALRVVVVDDDQDFREALRDMLSDEGFAVVAEAADGAEAVESITRMNPDVVGSLIATWAFNVPTANNSNAASVARILRHLIPRLSIHWVTK